MERMTLSISLKDVDEGGVVIAKLVAGKGKLGAFHLAFAGLSPELLDDLHDVVKWRYQRWMAARQQAAGGTDRDAPTEGSPTLLGPHGALAVGAESEGLAGQNLDDGARCADLGQVDVLRRYAGDLGDAPAVGGADIDRQLLAGRVRLR